MRNEARQVIENLQMGAKLKYYRRDVRHITLQDLSEKTGLSKPLLSQVENNLVTPPLHTLYLLCKALDISVLELLKDLEEQPEMDSWERGEAGLKQIEVGLAEVRSAFEELQPGEKARTKAPRSRRKSATKP